MNRRLAEQQTTKGGGCWNCLRVVKVTGGVLQGSFLRPVLFIICSNDTDIRINNFISEVADDTKVFISVLSGITFKIGVEFQLGMINARYSVTLISA